MADSKRVYRHSERATYRVENRQFNVSRTFGSDQTVSDLLSAELSSGRLQFTELSS